MIILKREMIWYFPVEEKKTKKKTSYSNVKSTYKSSIQKTILNFVLTFSFEVLAQCNGSHDLEKNYSSH